jgi:hypothetical protein
MPAPPPPPGLPPPPPPALAATVTSMLTLCVRPPGTVSPPRSCNGPSGSERDGVVASERLRRLAVDHSAGGVDLSGEGSVVNDESVASNNFEAAPRTPAAHFGEWRDSTAVIRAVRGEPVFQWESLSTPESPSWGTAPGRRGAPSRLRIGVPALSGADVRLSPQFAVAETVVGGCRHAVGLPRLARASSGIGVTTRSSAQEPEFRVVAAVQVGVPTRRKGQWQREPRGCCCFLSGWGLPPPRTAATWAFRRGDD